MIETRAFRVSLVTGVAVAVCTLTGFALTGCTQSGFSALQREQTANDELPSGFDEMDLSGYDRSTSRFSASYENNDFYLLVPEGGLSPCLAIAGVGGPVVVCGGGGSVESTLPDGTVVQFGPEPVPTGRGWVAISGNVRVRE